MRKYIAVLALVAVLGTAATASWATPPEKNGQIAFRRYLDLHRPIFQKTAAYGHFGRKPYRGKVNGKKVDFFTWERIDRVDALLRALR